MLFDLEENLRRMEEELRDLTDGNIWSFYRKRHRYTLRGWCLIDKCVTTIENPAKRIIYYSFIGEKKPSKNVKKCRTYAEVLRSK